MSRLSVRERKARKQKLLAAGLIVLTVAGFGGLAAYKVNQPPGPDPLLCPATGARGHVIVLIDKTDPLSFTQRKAVEDLLAGMAAGRHVREGELLAVYALGEDFKANAEPIFMRCHPGDGADKRRFKDNPEMWRKRYEEEFAKPIRGLLDKVVANQAATKSPIIEMLQLVGLAFERHGISQNRRFYVVSDMLQNTPEYSQYRDKPNFSSFSKRPSYPKMRAKLQGVDVEILMLMHRPEAQRRDLVQFWEEYFKDGGATVQKVDPLPG